MTSGPGRVWPRALLGHFPLRHPVRCPEPPGVAVEPTCKLHNPLSPLATGSTLACAALGLPVFPGRGLAEAGAITSHSPAVACPFPSSLLIIAHETGRG